MEITIKSFEIFLPRLNKRTIKRFVILCRKKGATFNLNIKIKLLFLTSFFLLGLLVIYTIPMFLPPSIYLGIYDPLGSYNSDNRIVLQNVYVSWGENTENLLQLLDHNKSLNRISLVTVEPWNSESTQQSISDLLTDIPEGKYNDSIDNTCRTLASINEPLIIRWGHEMELSGSRYSWAGKDPHNYQQSYRYFVTRCKTYSSKFKFMWSPSGEAGLEKYWPGKEFVDFIGLSVYSYDQWDIKYIKHQRSFNEVLSPKYDRVKQYNKPIIIAESGVTGDEEYKKKWITQLTKDVKNYPLLKGIVYFNSVDLPGAWGQDLGIADFRITKDSISPLLNIADLHFNLE